MDTQNDKVISKSVQAYQDANIALIGKPYATTKEEAQIIINANIEKVKDSKVTMQKIFQHFKDENNGERKDLSLKPRMSSFVPEIPEDTEIEPLDIEAAKTALINLKSKDVKIVSRVTVEAPKKNLSDFKLFRK